MREACPLALQPCDGLAGHETTGATITALLPELQKSPAVMEELRQEQARLVQRFGPEITCERPPFLLVHFTTKYLLCCAVSTCDSKKHMSTHHACLGGVDQPSK